MTDIWLFLVRDYYKSSCYERSHSSFMGSWADYPKTFLELCIRLERCSDCPSYKPNLTEDNMDSSQFLKLMISVGIFLSGIWLCIYTDFNLHCNVSFWLITLLLGSVIDQGRQKMCQLIKLLRKIHSLIQFTQHILECLLCARVYSRCSEMRCGSAIARTSDRWHEYPMRVREKAAVQCLLPAQSNEKAKSPPPPQRRWGFHLWRQQSMWCPH